MSSIRQPAPRAIWKKSRRWSLRAAPIAAVLGALAFAFALSGLLPVSGQQGSEAVESDSSDDWTATLTVGVSGAGSETTHGYSIFQGGVGTLSENTFNEDDQSIEVVAILLSNGFLAFNLTPHPTDDFVLTVDGAEFASADASQVKSTRITSYVWPTTQVWAEDDTVALSLSWIPEPVAAGATQRQSTVVDAPPPTPVVLPARPSGLSTTATHDSVALTWNDPGDATITHYQVFRRDTTIHAIGVFITLVDNTGSADTSYTDGTVESERKYVYRVKAGNAAGASQWSSYSSARTPVAPVPLVAADPPPAAEDLAPTGLTATLVEGGSVALSWIAPAEDVDNVTGYEILRAVGDGDSTTLVADTGNTTTSSTDATATEAGETYTYQVKAVRGEERSQASAEASVEVPAGAPDPPDLPPAPTVTACEFDAGGGDLPADTSSGCVLAVDGSVGGERATADDADWYRVSLQSSATYQVDMRGKSSGAWELVDGAPAFVSVGTLEDPKLLGVYDASGALVSGTDSEVAGTGKDSRIASFSPDADGIYFVSASAESGWIGTYQLSLGVTAGEHVAAPPPDAPTGLSGTATADAVTLSWEDPEHSTISGYRILRRERDVEASLTVTVSHDTASSATTFVDTTVSAATKYAYRILALNANGASAESAEAEVDTPGAVTTDNSDSTAKSVQSDESVSSNDEKELDSLKTIAKVENPVVVKQVVQAVGGFQQVDAGWRHACALRMDGTLECWGEMENLKQRCEGGPYDGRWVCGKQAETPEGIFTQVIAGFDRTCAIREDGSATCWERNYQPDSSQSKQQIHTNNLEGVCWLNSDGTVDCGAGMAGPPSSGTYTSISVGSYIACAIDNDDEAVCWSNHGARTVPTGTFKFLQVGGYRVCGIRSDSTDTDVDGTVLCWRYGDHSLQNKFAATTGQDSAQNASYTEDEQAAPTDKFQHLQVHYTRTCGVTETGQIKCWTRHGGGLGTLLTSLSGLTATDFETVSIDWYPHACALRSDNTITCWGYDGAEIDTPAFDSPWKTNAKLLTLELSAIDLEFDRDTVSYTLSVDNDVASTTVTTGATNTQASVAISPTDSDTSTDGHQVSLTAGMTTTITVTVTAADGVTTQAYTIAVTRAAM